MVSEVSTPSQLVSPVTFGLVKRGETMAEKASHLWLLGKGAGSWYPLVGHPSNDHLPVLPHYTQWPLLHIQDPQCSLFHASMETRGLHFLLHFCQVCLQFAQTKPTPLGLTLLVSVSCLHCYGQWNLNFIFCLLMTRAEKMQLLVALLARLRSFFVCSFC